jgi:hypothetical protein
MAKQQDYSNHIQFYPPHHFVFYPIGLAGVALGIWGMRKYPDACWLWASILLILVLLIWLSYMLRQHYALTLQDRLIRLEMRVRYHQLTGERLEKLESSLSFGQIAALRFASDEELPNLTQRTIQEGLSPNSIKKAIHNWQPDLMRV